MKVYVFRHKDKESSITILAVNKQAARAKLEMQVTDAHDWKLQHN